MVAPGSRSIFCHTERLSSRKMRDGRNVPQQQEAENGFNGTTSEIGQLAVNPRALLIGISGELPRAKLSRPYQDPFTSENAIQTPDSTLMKTSGSRFKNLTWMGKFRSEGRSTGQK